jgi:hypothetical protein
VGDDGDASFTDALVTASSQISEQNLGHTIRIMLADMNKASCVLYIREGHCEEIAVSLLPQSSFKTEIYKVVTRTYNGPRIL